MKTTQTCVKQIVLALASAAMLGGMAPSASAATVLLSDTFTTADSTDINATVAARQTGTLAPVSYVYSEGIADPYSISGNALKSDAFQSRNISVSPNYNFTAFNNYSISVKIRPPTPDWSTFIIGSAATESHFSFQGTEIFMSGATGAGTVFDNGGGGATGFGASAPDANGYWNLRFDISTVGANILTGNATVTAYVQNAQVATFTRTSAYASNFVSMMGANGTVTYWDDLKVTSVIPEPASALLLGLAGLAFAPRMRRARKTA